MAVGSASADRIGDKRAQAQRVMAQIAVLDASLERARNRYNAAEYKLQGIEHSLKINRVALTAA